MILCTPQMIVIFCFQTIPEKDLSEGDSIVWNIFMGYYAKKSYHVYLSFMKIGTNGIKLCSRTIATCIYTKIVAHFQGIYSVNQTIFSNILGYISASW